MQFNITFIVYLPPQQSKRVTFDEADMELDAQGQTRLGIYSVNYQNSEASCKRVG